jgi:hypothetical protein
VCETPTVDEEPAIDAATLKRADNLPAVIESHRVRAPADEKDVWDIQRRELSVLPQKPACQRKEVFTRMADDLPAVVDAVEIRDVRAWPMNLRKRSSPPHEPVDVGP